MYRNLCYFRRRGSPGPSGPSFFLEATQRKTVCTVTVVLRIEPGGVEAQVVGTGARKRRRPTVATVTDATYFTVLTAAIARGRLQFALQKPLAATRLSKNNLRPRALGNTSVSTHR